MRLYEVKIEVCEVEVFEGQRRVIGKPHAVVYHGGKSMEDSVQHVVNNVAAHAKRVVESWQADRAKDQA